jgi:predicted DNA binding CopG/RHH family protein
MAKDYHRKPQFQLRLEPRILESLRRKAEKRGLPLNQYIAEILERENDDTTAYHRIHPGKHAGGLSSV